MGTSRAAWVGPALNGRWPGVCERLILSVTPGLLWRTAGHSFSCKSGSVEPRYMIRQKAAKPMAMPVHIERYFTNSLVVVPVTTRDARTRTAGRGRVVRLGTSDSQEHPIRCIAICNARRFAWESRHAKSEHAL